MLPQSHSIGHLYASMVMALASVNIGLPQPATDRYTPKSFKPMAGYGNQSSPPNLPPNSSKDPQQKPAKKWWAVSKTVWFNLGVTALGVAGAVFPVADSVLPFAKPFMTPETFAVATAVIGAGNVALRTMTKTQLTSKAQAETGLDKPHRYD